MKKIWNDPVWSKVISSFIITLISFLGTIIFVGLIDRVKSIRSILNSHIQVKNILLLLAVFFISRVIYLIYKNLILKFKKETRLLSNKELLLIEGRKDEFLSLNIGSLLENMDKILEIISLHNNRPIDYYKEKLKFDNLKNLDKVMNKEFFSDFNNSINKFESVKLYFRNLNSLFNIEHDDLLKNYLSENNFDHEYRKCIRDRYIKIFADTFIQNVSSLKKSGAAFVLNKNAYKYQFEIIELLLEINRIHIYFTAKI